MSQSRIVWAALESNGQIVVHSSGIVVPQGPFGTLYLEVSAPPSVVAPGKYNFIVVLSNGPTSVGTLDSYADITEPMPVQIGAAGAATSTCVQVLFGDSLKLKANLTSTNEVLITERTDGQSSDPGVIWEALNPGGVQSETQYFVDLRNGDFYPLKPNDDSNRIWQVRATIGSLSGEADVDVNPNVLLGTSYKNYDGLILEKAAEFGVPPALSKAQVFRETSVFERTAYRYEPRLDYQYVTFGIGYTPTNPLLGRTNRPYRRYNIAIPAGWQLAVLPQGDLLDTDDISFRSKYSLDQNSDGVFTVWEIFDLNASQNWDLRPPANFVAQTTIGSTYGLKQVWWATATEDLGWNGGNGDHPVNLCDATQNLFLGTKYLRLIYDHHTDPALGWDERWKLALVRYKAGFTAERDDTDYEDFVYDHIDDFKPVGQ